MDYIEFADLAKRAISALIKLQKINKHTDPSVQNKRKVFVQKYKDLVEEMVGGIKELDGYENLNAWFNLLKADKPLDLSERNLEILLGKVRKDIDAFFAEKPILPELKSSIKPDYVKKYQPIYHAPPPKKNEPETPDPQRYYTKEDLMDLVRTTKAKRQEAKQRKKALNELNDYIGKIRKLDPQLVSKKISEIIKK